MPASWLEQNPEPADVCRPCNFPCGATSNIHEDATCPTMHNTIPVRPAVGRNDRILHNKIFMLSFAVENNILISKVPSLLKFAQFLSKDPKTLSGLKLDRTSENYKLKEGLAQYNHESLVTKLKRKHFSLNLDECTANAKDKIFSILVTFFEDDRRESIVAHYDSVLLTEANAETVFSEIDNCFSRNGIPWNNLISDFSDSAAYMRGKFSGAESKLRDKAPHLLDIDGDVFPHMHISVKPFSKPFNKYVERLLMMFTVK